MLSLINLRNSLILFLLLAGWSPQQALAAPATHFLVTVPATTNAGTPFTATVTAQDQYGNPVITSDTFQVNTDDPLVSNPAVTGVFAAASTATVSLTLKTAGSHVLTPVDTSVVLPGTSIPATVVVNAAGLDHLKVTAPTPQVAGTPFTATVTAQDQYGNPVITSDTFQVNTDDPLVSNPAVTGVFAAASTATVSLTLKTAGSHVLTPVDTSVVLPGTSIPATVAVNAAGLDHLKVTAPTPQVAGTPFTATVTAQDQYGNPVITSDTFQVNTDDPLVSNPAAPSAFVAASTATVSLTLKTAGSHVLTPVDTSVVLPGTSIPATVAVNAAGLDHLKVTAPTPQVAGTPFTATVTAQDQYGNPVITSDAFQVNTDDPLVSNPAVTGAFAAASTATVSLTLKTAGSHVLTPVDTNVVLPGASIPATVVVNAAGLDHLKVTAPTPQVAGTPFTATVTAQDQFGNPVVTSDAFQVNTDDPLVSNPAVTGVFAAASTATVSLTLETVGSHVLTPSDTMSTLLGPPLTATVAISPGPATHFTLVAPGSTNAGVPFTLAITARDAYGNVATGYAGTFALTSDDPAVSNLAANQTLTSGVGTLSAILYTSGNRKITAKDSATATITGTSPAIAVSSQGANHFQVSAPTSATAGISISVTVTAFDQFNNKATTYTGTVTISSTDGSATLGATILPTNTTLANGVGSFAVTLKTAGTQTITATDSVNTGFTGTTNTLVVNNILPTIDTISPATKTAGDPGFTITVTNADGSYINNSVVQWNGLPLPTMFVDVTTLKATVSAGLIATAGSAAVTVANPAPGGGVSAPVTVVINNPTPTLTDLSPNTIVRGSPAFSLKLTGTNFVSGSVAYWGGSPRPTTFVSSTQLNAAIAASDVAASGTIQVTVHTSDPNISTGHDSGALPFTISPFPVPIVSRLSPTSATRGDTVTLTINGANFRPNATVTIGTLPLGPVVFVSSSQLSVTFTLDLKAAPGPFPVVVTNDDVAPSNASAIFTVNAQTVSINSPTPSFVVVTTDPTVKQIVTIPGFGFRSGDTVAFGSVAIDLKQVVVNTQSQITVTLTVAQAKDIKDVIGNVGTYNVVVTSPDNTSSAKDAFGNSLPATPFTVGQQVVTISLISPESATVGDPTFLLTINGTGFKSGAKVFFGGTMLDPSLVNFVSATQITAKIGGSDFVDPETNLLATAGVYPVQVTNPDGSPSNQKTFTVNPQKNTVNSLVPPTVNVGDPTFLLTINGTGFKSGAKVSFGGTVLDQSLINVVSVTQITAKIGGSDFVDPETNLLATAGAYPVQVTNPDGSPSTTSSTFRVAPLAPVSGFQPGLQMISVPYDYSPEDYPTPSAASASIFKNFGAVDAAGNLTELSLPLKLAVWDPATAVYDMTNYAVDTTPSFAGLADALLVGRGYWVRIPDQTVGLIRRGFLAADPATVRPSTDVNGKLILVPLLTGQQVPVPLASGWNMVGDPFPGPVLIGTLKVQSGNQTYSYADAVSLGLISGTLYSYDSAGNKYAAQDATKTLDPYVGYWILALQPCTLLVPQP